MSKTKEIFLKQLKEFAKSLTKYVSTNSGEWSIKGFIDIEDSRKKGSFKKLTKLSEFLEFKGMNVSLINPPKPKRKNKK